MTRRGFVRTLAVGAPLLFVPGLARPALARGSRELITGTQRKAIADGLRWIARNQIDGGTWGSEKDTRIADTSLCLLALMGGGNTVSAGRPLEFGSAGKGSEGVVELRGSYARQVRDGIRYLAREAWDKNGPPGYIHDDKNSRMHGHGFATLALAQAVGNLGGKTTSTIQKWLDADPGRDPSQLDLGSQVRHALSRAVYCIEHSQDRDTGGWLYEPYQQGHEGSMTVTQIGALRAARDAGLKINDEVLRKAYEYVRSSQNLSTKEHYGGFAYMKTMKDRVSYALTAAALSTLYGLGRYGRKEDAKIFEDGFRYMDRTHHETLGAQQWFYYSMFYGALALYMSQDAARLGSQWPDIREALLKLQERDGSFARQGYDNRSTEYCTAMAVLTLQVPIETLPIFQRR